MAECEPTTFVKVLRARYPQTNVLDASHSEPGMYGKTFRGSDQERHHYIVGMVRKAVKKFDVQVVAVEDYAYSKGGRSATILRELGGVVKYELFRQGVVIIPPINIKTLKKWATGSGSADKARMIEVAIGMGGGFDPGNNDNLADALHLARYAGYVYSGQLND